MLDLVDRLQMAALPPAARRIVERMGEIVEGFSASLLPTSNCPPAPSAPAEHPASSPKLLTPRDAAEALAVCEKTLWSMTKRGEIPAVRIGRAVRYSSADLTRWIEQQKLADN